MTYSQYGVYWFECDQNGRYTRCCGAPNSNSGTERPFVVLTSHGWNRQHKEEIFVIPLTKQMGNVNSLTIGKDDTVPAGKLQNSNILCDKLSKVREDMIWLNDNEKVATLSEDAQRQVLLKVKNFLTQTINLP